MTQNIKPEPAACDYCGQLIVENGHDYTNDILICTTRYHEDGEVHKTMEPTSTLHTDVDYITICPDCEGPMFRAWNELAEKLITNGLPRDRLGDLVNSQIALDEGAIDDGLTNDEK